MKMHEIYQSKYIKMYPDLRDKLFALIEKHYPHLRHSLRGEIEIDAFLRDEIIKILGEK